MTDEHLTPDREDVLNLQQLVRARMDERGWSYGDLERLSGHRLTKGRWQQIATGARQTNFPVPATIQIVADVLEIEVTTVLIAAGRSVGLDARRRSPGLAGLLPAGTDQLSERMRDGLLAIIRAAVAERQASQDEKALPSNRDITLEWPHTRPPHLNHGSA